MPVLKMKVPKMEVPKMAKSAKVKSAKWQFRKFLRALPTKWRPKVTTIKESKDLSTLLLDELIGNLKVYEVVLKKDSEASKNKKEKYKSLALKPKKVSSDEEASSLDSEDEEYAMVAFQKAKEDKKGKVDRKCFKCGDPNHFISDCPKHSYNDQKAFVGVTWSDSDEDEYLKKDKICIMAHDSNEGLGFTEHKASTSGVKTGKTGKNDAKNVTEDPTHPDPSERDPTSVSEGIRATVTAGINLKPVLQNRTNFVQITKKTSPSTTVGNTKQPPALKLSQGLAKGDYVDRKSTSGVCTFMGCCLTSWFSKKQTSLAMSTTEAEHVSTSKACQQAL
ncbi:zf-CCHC domain-containing protein [Tanacetum coccineum]